MKPGAARSLVDACWRSGYRVAFLGFAVYGWVLRPRLRSAHVLVWSEHRLLVVRHSYKRGLSAPAGMVQRRESAREGAVRELAEEVGISVAADALEEVARFTTRRERARDTVHVFQVRPQRVPELAIDRREIIWADFLSLEDIHRERLRPIFAEILEQTDLDNQSTKAR